MYHLHHIYSSAKACARVLQCAGMEEVTRRFSLTICDLQLSLGEDTACNGQGLADIVTSICPLHRWDGEVSAGWHREATVGLLGLVGKEQILEEEVQTAN